MEPQVNNPGWVKGLEMFIDAQKAFPGGGNFGLGDEIFSFGGGQTLMSYSWDDAFIQAQEADSPIRNKVAAAPAGCQRGMESHDQELGQVRDAQRTTLHHLGLDLRRGQSIEEPGYGLRLSLLLLERGEYHARSADRPIWGESL